MLKKTVILFNALLGECIKLWFTFGFGSISYGLTRIKRPEGHRVIVSLTSYGRRVSSVLPFTIISLLKQSFKPDLIVLWLDKDNWNESNIPTKLSRLQKYGLTIKFCDDLKSYKKLVPALEEYPNDIIIAVDDDFYYRNHLIQQLIDAWNMNPNCIYTHRACGYKVSSDNNMLPYNLWDKEIENRNDKYVFPLGGSGCLYKRNLLYKDVLRRDLFMKLTPNADDVWFFVMEVLQGTQRVVLPCKKKSYILLDLFYQFTHKSAALYNTNDKEGGNDWQIQSVSNYYHIDWK